MERRQINLDKIRVAAPCKMSWEAMDGDEQARFCHRCKLNVYNLSAMSREEAEQLVLQSEGRLCVRFYRRRDGTLLTRNCPVGKREAQNRWLLAGVLSGLFTLALGFRHYLVESQWIQKLRCSQVGQTTPVRQVLDALYPQQPVIMGAIPLSELKDEGSGRQSEEVDTIKSGE